jgi:uncharacterized protein (DUF1015 family)
MVDILPFKGIRYALDEIEKVVSPPYDVISPEERDEYYSRHEKNVIRLILGKDEEGDNESNNKYIRAREYLESWLKDGTLVRDEEPSIYAYYMDYLHDGKRKVLKGFIALCRLEEFEKKVILPHEETLRRAIEDRFELLKACRANFSQIYTLYSDPEKRIEDLLEKSFEEPLIDISVDGVRHRLWKISDKSTIEKVKSIMKEKQLFIADGHHRYTTALIFRDEMRKKGLNYDYTLMYMANMDCGGVTILPAHRLIADLEELDFNRFLRQLEENFSITRASKQEMFEEMRRNRHSYGLYNGSYYYLKLQKNLMNEIFGNTKSKAWKNLAVTILRYLVIENVLGLNDEGHINYEIDAEKAIRAVDRGEYKMVFFVNPTRVEEVRDVALNGERMPGKATYFYPKPLTGLVINKLD